MTHMTVAPCDLIPGLPVNDEPKILLKFTLFFNC
jgi:hypothetical protein